jgi:transcriptional repressor NrdR
VAYVRFASVYRQFQSVSDFVATLEGLSHPSQSRGSQGKGRLAIVG